LDITVVTMALKTISAALQIHYLVASYVKIRDGESEFLIKILFFAFVPYTVG